MSDQKHQSLLRLLNILFHASHLAVILFSVLGWILPETRPLHLALQAIILFSWFGLGIFKGWTYCFLTDLHWRVMHALRQPPRGESYIKLLVDKLTGGDADPDRVDRYTVTVFFVTTALSLLLFLNDIL